MLTGRELEAALITRLVVGRKPLLMLLPALTLIVGMGLTELGGRTRLAAKPNLIMALVSIDARSARGNARSQCSRPEFRLDSGRDGRNAHGDRHGNAAFAFTHAG